MTTAGRTEQTAEKASFFKVSGLDCGSCAVRIETALSRLPGVTTVEASVTSETVTVRHRPEVSMATLANKLDALGYGVDGMADSRAGLVGSKTATASASGEPTSAANAAEDSGHHDEAHRHGGEDERAWWRKPDGILVVACSATVAASFVLGIVWPTARTVLLLLATLLGLAPVALKALRGIRAGFPFSIETLLVIAALGAIALGAIDEAAIVVLLFLIGELLEGMASGQARRGIRGLTALMPKTALVEHGEQLVEVPITELVIGTVIVVRPGDRISADGEIISGTSSIDDSPVTGESTPKTKSPGDQVFAGSINHDATLHIRVTADAGNNTIARIARLVEQAQDRKSPTQRFIGRFSQIYTPVVFAIGVAVAVIPPLFGADWATWIYRGLAVLLIGCPCALVISTPAAIASGIAAGTKRGLLLKGGEVLENLSGVTTVAFDKTGTLTSGVPCVTDIRAFGMTEAQALALAAAVEAVSSHPLAKAIVDHAGRQGVAVKTARDTSTIAGKGASGTVDGLPLYVGSPKSAAETAALTEEQHRYVETLYGEGKTVVVLVAGGMVAGIFGLRDEAKPDARQGVELLRKAGIKALMLTGDNRSTATAIAAPLGMEVHSELMPQDKMRIVSELQGKGEVVAKVGDGINDAPALAAADIGIAMAGGSGGGTDIALETGDAAILQGRVADVAALIDLARRTMRNIHQNLAIAIGLKCVFLVTTIFGVTGLWPAIFADTGATILVTANALRLLRAR